MLKTPFFEALSSIADILTLISLISGAIYAILNRTKSVIAFTIAKVLAGSLKVAVIIFILALLFRLLEIVYIAGLLIFRGGFNDKNYYWEEGYEIFYLAAYFIFIVVFAFCSWIVGSIIWTGSINPTKMLFNFFLPPNKRLRIEHFKTLNIISARYGTFTNYIDVTEALKKMIEGNRLQITASNKIAGDPIVNVPKTLTIEYKYDNENAQKIEVSENYTTIIEPT